MKPKRERARVMTMVKYADIVARKLFTIQVNHFKHSEIAQGLHFRELIKQQSLREVLDLEDVETESYVYTALIGLYTKEWNTYADKSPLRKGQVYIWRAAMATFMMGEVVVATALSEQLNKGIMSMEAFLERIRKLVATGQDQIHNYWFKSNETLKLSFIEEKTSARVAHN